MIIQDIILIALVLVAMAVGFLVMRRLDKFLEENRRSVERENREQNPSNAVLSTKMSDEEIIARIRAYEEEYGEAEITVRHNEDNLRDGAADDKK